MPSKNVTLVEAAHRLAVPWHTAYRFALVGRLEGKKTGSRWRVTEESVKRVAKELRAER